MILLTGPTGSGKTTTLYSMIARRRSPEINIVTVEDPIEYQLAGISQVQVNVKTGLTFASSLRSILRQDPDVILVGEIRDAETAEIAFQAEATGHLVLSTLHTNSSFAAIARLLELGIDPFLITSSLNLVVAQRLVRRICAQCKEPYHPPAELLQRCHINNADQVFYRGRGCPACGKSGFSGRMGIYEMLRLTSGLKELIRTKAGEAALRRTAARSGARTLMEDGLDKVRDGSTNPEELLRVVELEAEDNFPCPKCNAMVTWEFKTCPYCMIALQNRCTSCGQNLKPEWKMCPYCTTPVSAPAVPVQESPKVITQGRDEPALSPSRLLSQQTTASSAVKCPKILIADDDQGISTLIRKALEQLPMDVEVFAASDGIAALEAIELHGADLVILDVNMPRMDGFAVCDRLRKDIRTAFLPILMLTANSDQNNRTKGFLVGTDDYMSKPFVMPDLVARVTRLLRRTYGL